MLQPSSQRRPGQLWDHNWVLLAVHSTSEHVKFECLYKEALLSSSPQSLPCPISLVWVNLVCHLGVQTISCFLLSWPLILTQQRSPGRGQRGQVWMNCCGHLDQLSPKQPPCHDPSSSDMSAPRQGNQMPFSCLCDLLIYIVSVILTII